MNTYLETPYLAIVLGIVGILIIGITPIMELVRSFYAVDICIFDTRAAGAKPHGFIWTLSETDKATRVSFVVNESRKLNKPSKYTLEHIWKQLERGGIRADSLEIRVGGRVRIYRAGQTRPAADY